MATAKTTPKVEPKQETHFVEDAMKMMKSNHNWKFFLGFILGWVLEYLIYQ